MVESKHKYSTYVLLAIIGVVCIVMLVEGLDGFGNSGSVPKFIYGDVLGNSSIVDDLNSSLIFTSSICTSMNGLCNGSINITDDNNYPTNLSVSSLNGLNTITIGRSNLSDLIASYLTSLNYTSGFTVAPLQYFNEQGVAGNLTNNGAVYNSTNENYQFNGGNQTFGGYLYSSNFPNFDNTSFYISVWIKPQTISGFVLSKMAGGANTAKFYSIESCSGGYYLNFANGSIGDSNFQCAVTPLNSWTHLVFVYDVNGTTYNYINGQLNATINNLLPNLNASNTNPITIGTRNNGLASTVFNGTIDTIQIGNRSLSASEVLLLNQSGRGGSPVNKSGLVLWAPFSNFTDQGGIDTNLNNTNKNNYGINNYTLAPICVNNFGVLQRC